MKKFEKYIQKIHHDFPDFTISSIKKTGEGDNSKAFLINGNYIFRFPKRKEVKQQVAREATVLPKIQPFLNLRIPQFEFISPDISFVGYQIIPGTPLTLTIYNSLNKKKQASIQQSIGNFLSQLHHIDSLIVRDCGLDTMNHREEYSDNFREVQKIIFPHLSKNRRKIITKLFTDYLSDATNFGYIPAIIHNDFSKDHILFDIENKKITGIIDFGDIAFGDPDYDLLYLLDEFGEDFLKGLFRIYKPKNRKGLIKKLYFFTLAIRLQGILGNKEDNESEDMKESYEDLNSWFKNFNTKINP
ncbi:MAG: aminoglycoside phosphotransferase family protein [Ginsengibacter sp.]